MRVTLRLLLMIAVLSAWSASARAKTWTTSGADQFVAGELEGVSVLSTGEVQLAPVAEEIEGLEAALVWDVEAAPDGSIYVGTGAPGGVYRLREGKLETLHDAGKKHVLSVLPLLDGGVLAATAPGGVILRIDRQGNVETFAERENEYVWDMVLSPTHEIYCATGPEGHLLQFDRAGKCTELLKVKQTHLMCVAAGPDGIVYAGTAPDGYVYRVDRNGQSTVLYDADEDEVHDIVVDAEGVIYVCTAQREGGPQAPAEQSGGGPTSGTAMMGAPSARNSIYRIIPAEGATEIARFDKLFVLSLALFNGRLLAGTGPGGRLMAVEGDDTGVVLTEFDSAHITGIAVMPDGDAIIGTSNAGALWRLEKGFRQEGSFLSKPFDAGYLSQWGTIWWEQNADVGQTVRLKLRTGNSSEPDDHWSEWSRWTVEPAGDRIDVPLGRFAQVSAELNTRPRTGSPSLLEINVSYRQANRKPAIQDVLIDGVSLLQNRTNNQGSRQPGRPSPGSAPRRGDDGNGRTTVKTIQWKAADPNDDDLAFDLYYRGLDEEAWKLVEEDLRNTNACKWDTSRVPDGRYLLKLVARDDVARPQKEALSDQKVTPPLIIDNRPPAVLNLNAQRQADGSYEITGLVRDDLSRIAGIEVSVNSEDWGSVFSGDGIFDSPEEGFSYRTDVLEPGEYVFVFAAGDGEGNTGSAKAIITVPAGQQ